MLASEPRATNLGCLSAGICALDYPFPLVLRESRQEGQEASTNSAGQVEMWLVEYLDERATGVKPLDNVDAIDHTSRTAVPLGEHQNIASAERVYGPLQLWPVLGAPATRLLFEDASASLRD